MSESVYYRAEFNIEDFVNKYVERVNREIDQRVLDKVEHRLAEYGYVKVVRCRDCVKWHHIDTEDGIRCGECDEWRRADSCCVPATREDGFCAWSARKEVDNDN